MDPVSAIAMIRGHFEFVTGSVPVNCVMGLFWGQVHVIG